MNVETQLPKHVSEDELQQLWAGAADLADFIVQLHYAGASKIESVRALRRVTGMALHEAKVLVHTNPAWEARRVEDEAFHTNVVQVLEDGKAAADFPERLAG